MRGKFIVLEGGEGCGKTSVAKHLAAKFNAMLTREPGGTEDAERIRNLVLFDEKVKLAPAAIKFGLLWGARYDHIQKKILPALEQGQHVITDRFDASTFAYQLMGEQDGEELMTFFPLMRRHCLTGCVPDLYLWLDVDPRIGMERRAGRGDQATYFDEQKLPFHEKVRLGYRAFFLNYATDECSVRIINTEQPLDRVIECAEDLVRECIEAPKVLQPCP